jgi:hypothetical protein
MAVIFVNFFYIICSSGFTPKYFPFLVSTDSESCEEEKNDFKLFFMFRNFLGVGRALSQLCFLRPHLIVFIEKPMPIIPLALNKTNTLKIDLDNLDSDDEKMEEEEEGIKKAKNFNLEKMDSLTFEQEMAERMKSM